MADHLAPVLRAAAEALQAVVRTGCRACLIGGLAVQRWGQPRFTNDADLTVLAPLGGEAEVIDALLAELRPRSADARAHALRFRVLLLTSSAGVDIDVSLAASPFEEDVLARATRWKRAAGVWLETCSAEDLVIYKLIAARGQDLVDVETIVRRQGARLDVDRIRQWGTEFAPLKEDPDLLRPFEQALARARPGG